MGNWRNRRRFFYHQYKDPASSYYDHRRPSSPFPEFADHGVPLWEKKFCTLIGSVPWQKIVNAKKFLYCHDTVINWDDSAGEDAFKNAKNRFWAEINCLPCQISLPDPDMYIDEINWHPDIDPELVKELERAFFAPEEGENDRNAEHKSKKTRSMESVPLERWNWNPDDARTPWECDNKIGSKVALKEKGEGWNQGHISTNNSSNVNNGDTPWGSCFPQENKTVEGKTWGNCGDKLSGWNHSVNHVNQVNDWDSRNLNNNNNPWDCSISQENAVKGDGWGDSSDKLWGWNHSVNQVNLSKVNGGNPWERSSQVVGSAKDKAWGKSHHISWGSNKQEVGKFGNGGYSQQSSIAQGSQNLKDRQGRGSDGTKQSWKPWDNPYRGPKDLEYRQPGGSWRTWDDDGHRKREGSHHYTTSNKHARFQRNEYQAGHRWNGRATKKRVSFAYE